MCFTYDPRGIVAGVATAAGAVRTAPVDLDSWSLQGARTSTPSTLVADVQPLVTMTGYGHVCVGGVGLRVVAGSVTFTFEAHTSTDSIVTVVTCTYGPSSGVCA